MPHPDEGLIHAWLDGELDADEARRVQELVERDPEWGRVAAEARGFVAAATRIVGTLDRGSVVPAQRTRSVRPRKWGMTGAAAGSVVMVSAGAIALQVLPKRDRTDATASKPSESQPAAVAPLPVPSSATGEAASSVRSGNTARKTLARENQTGVNNAPVPAPPASTGALADAALRAAPATPPTASTATAAAGATADARAVERDQLSAKSAVAEKRAVPDSIRAESPQRVVDRELKESVRQDAKKTTTDTTQVRFTAPVAVARVGVAEAMRRAAASAGNRVVPAASGGDDLRCFVMFLPADSAGRVLRLKDRAITDSLRLGRFAQSGDTLTLRVQPIIFAKVMTCPSP